MGQEKTQRQISKQTKEHTDTKTDNFGQQKTKVYQQPNADFKAVALLTLNKHTDKNIIKSKISCQLRSKK